MQIKIFTLPVYNFSSEEDELNLFLRTHKVLELYHEFFQTGNSAVWCFCVKYIEGAIVENKNRVSQKVDYKDVLDEHCFAVFSQLRECRKQIAQEEAIPPYAVFIDEELAGIARLDTITEQTIASVNGIGKKKTERFGKRIIELYQIKQNEKTE